MQILHKIILPFHSKIFFILKIYDFRVILEKIEKMGKITEIYFIENQRFGMFQTQCYSEERRPLSSMSESVTEARSMCWYENG
jgi:hypothetical protein